MVHSFIDVRKFILRAFLWVTLLILNKKNQVLITTLSAVLEQ
jgi:hypothetical protein